MWMPHWNCKKMFFILSMCDFNVEDLKIEFIFAFAFSNWAILIIFRHLLLKLQGTLRAKSAQERRNVAEQETRSRQGLHHHEECSVPGRGSLSDPALHTRLAARSAAARRDAWEPSPGRHAATSAPPPSVGSVTTQRTKTAVTNRQASASYRQVITLCFSLAWLKLN